ncbi:MAG: formylglycine-generating enzyme family protein [Myxococcota bacterium]
MLPLGLILTATAAPAGMVLIPSGHFIMGRDWGRHAEEQPAHEVQIDSFWLDSTLVTVADYRAFVERSGFRTSAERLGYGMTAVEGMRDWQWEKRAGASWRAPFGTERAAEIPIADDWPVTMVSWKDADAYCRALGKRLPTEAEWEYAMRAGKSRLRFPWGDQPRRPDGKLGLNYWQGTGHEKNTREDGHLYLSPVRAFPPNDFGLYDPVGNVWQWVADWYAADTYQREAKGAHNPRGPSAGTHKVARGGSWWCSATTCSGFGLFARGKTEPDAPFSNNGFRCALDLR